MFADDGYIRVEHLPEELREALVTRRVVRGHGQDEQARLAHALAVFQGTRGDLARHLGMSERTLYRRLRELGLE